MGQIKKLKLDFDRKAGEEFAKKLNTALKNVDKAGKKKVSPRISHLASPPSYKRPTRILHKHVTDLLHASILRDFH